MATRKSVSTIQKQVYQKQVIIAAIQKQIKVMQSLSVKSEDDFVDSWNNYMGKVLPDLIARSAELSRDEILLYAGNNYYFPPMPRMANGYSTAKNNITSLMAEIKRLELSDGDTIVIDSGHWLWRYLIEE